METTYATMHARYMGLHTKVDMYDPDTIDTDIMARETAADTLDHLLDDLEEDLTIILTTTIPNLMEADEVITGQLNAMQAQAEASAASAVTQTETLLGLVPVVTSLFVDIEKLSKRYESLYADDAETYDYSYKTVKDKYDGLQSDFSGITIPPAELAGLATADEIQAWIDANSPLLAQAELDIAAANALIPGQSAQFSTLFEAFITDGYKPEISAHYFFINDVD